MADEKEAAIAAIAENLVEEDFNGAFGYITGLLDDTLAAKQLFMIGAKAGATYMLSMVIEGKINLTIVERSQK